MKGHEFIASKDFTIKTWKVIAIGKGFRICETVPNDFNLVFKIYIESVCKAFDILSVR